MREEERARGEGRGGKEVQGESDQEEPGKEREGGVGMQLRIAGFFA